MLGRLAIVAWGLMLCIGPRLFAQMPIDFEFGVRAGVPFDVGLESTLVGALSIYTRQTYDRSAFAGPTFGVTLNHRVTVQFDAIYKPIRFQNSVSSTVDTTRGSSWEFPLTAIYRFGRGSIRPYGGGGTVLRERISGTTENETTDARTGTKTLRVSPYSPFFHQTPAFVIDGGLEWSRGHLLIRPGVRYTHWSSVNQPVIAARTSNQFDCLVGFSFRGGK